MTSISRRQFGKSLIATGTIAFASTQISIQAFAAELIMTAPDAKKQAESKKVILIDVRSPQEWKQTGIAEAAHTISIHEKGFLAKLNKVMSGDKTKRVAFICATGVRSHAVQRELQKRGYTNIISVAEGMLGGRYGKGWIPRGMPIKKFEIAN